MIKDNKIPRAKSAESIGINSSVIQKMAEELALQGIDVHSMMVIRNGMVACEGYSAPYTADMPHMVYSVSKSFLSTAYGFALSEGKITRETRFIDVFPEYAPKKKENKLEKLTIHHLITMTAGKQSSTSGVKKKNRLKSFVRQKWLFSPGEGWRYVNENYYIASAMLVKVLGESITDYLTPRLYEPLGIEVPFWEHLENNIEAGGWGLMLKTEDIAKFILCYCNGGIYNGKQVIPPEWVEEATGKYADNSGVEKHSDSAAGYGCGFWQCAGMENTYRCEGMFCQYGIVFKDYNACLVITSNHSDLQEMLDVIWKYMPTAFSEPRHIEKSVTSILLPDKTSVTVKPRSSIEKDINGNCYRMRRCKFINLIKLPVSVFPMPVVFFAEDNGGNMNNLLFRFNDNGCLFSWEEDGGYKNTLFMPMDGETREQYVKIGDLDLLVRAYAYWENENTIVMNIRPMAAVADRILKFEFTGKKIKMSPSSKPGTDEKAKKIGDKLKCILVGKYFHWWIDFLVPRVNRILNPVHYGKIKEL